MCVAVVQARSAVGRLAIEAKSDHQELYGTVLNLSSHSATMSLTWSVSAGRPCGKFSGAVLVVGAS